MNKILNKYVEDFDPDVKIGYLDIIKNAILLVLVSMSALFLRFILWIITKTKTTLFG
jgi:hypothetical protein